uniref:U-box domain-containing protein n=1 Tax=viral metagenome TaxID=1070528 RepID=A0A6C0ABV7_9ZZZZ
MNISNSPFLSPFVQQPIIDPPVITDLLLGKMEDELKNNSLKEEDINILKKDLKHHSDIFFSYMFREKPMLLWKFVMTPDNGKIWDNFNKYVCDKKIYLNELLEIDKDVVKKTFLYSSTSITSKEIENLKSRLIVFYIIDQITFNNESDLKITNCIKPLMKIDSFNEIIIKILRAINKTFNTGMFVLEYESKYVSNDLMAKLLYIYLEDIDLDTYVVSKEKNQDKRFNVIETLFDCFYNNLFNRKLTVKKLLTDKQEALNMYLSENNQITVMSLYSIIKSLKDYLMELDKCIENKELNNQLEYFFTKLILTKKYTDNTLNGFSIFFKYNKNNFNNDIAEFIIETINTKNNTTNPHIRSSFLQLATTHKNPCNVFDEKLTEASINFFNDVELSKDSSMETEKGFIREDVYRYFIDNFKVDQIKQLNENKVKMFMNFIVRDLSTFFEGFEQIVIKYLELTDDYKLQTQTGLINNVIDYLDNAISILTKFIDSESVKDHLLSSEILIIFRSVVAKALNIYNSIFIEENERVIEIEKFVYTEIYFYKPLLKLLKIVSKLDKDSLEQVFNDSGIKRDIYDRVTTFLTSIDPNVPIVDLTLVEKSNDDIEYPDEFLDDITYEVLYEPVVIPGTKEQVITNRSSIAQYIMTDGLNPYTKEPLSLEDLDKYNEPFKEKMEDLKKKIQEFKLKSKT